MQASFHSGVCCTISRDMMMHEAVNSGLRIVHSKDWLFEVGLAH